MNRSASTILREKEIRESLEGSPLHVQALAFAIMHHALQVLWYVVLGVLGLATPWVSFSEILAVRKVAPAGAPVDDPA